MRLPFILLLPLLSGCAVTELSPAGANVEVGTGARSDCKFVGAIHASEGGNARTPETNIEAVQASLRNQAADLGGNSIVITSQQLGTASGPGYVLPKTSLVVGGGCANCISMMASVYRCGGGDGTVRVSRSGPDGSPLAPSSDAPSSRSGEFSRSAAAAALSAAALKARECKPTDGTSGAPVVKATFATTGDVVFIDVIGAPFAGTPVADCIERIFRKAHVPAFQGESVTASKTVVFE